VVDFVVRDQSNVLMEFSCSFGRHALSHRMKFWNLVLPKKPNEKLGELPTSLNTTESNYLQKRFLLLLMEIYSMKIYRN